MSLYTPVLLLCTYLTYLSALAIVGDYTTPERLSERDGYMELSLLRKVRPGLRQITSLLTYIVRTIGQIPVS